MSSLTAFSFRLGRITSLTPRRCAARTFSLMPPTGSTRPVRVISPVMATRGRTGRPVRSDASAVTRVIPAEGPSLGIAPSGTCRCRSTRSKNDSSMPSWRAWAGQDRRAPPLRGVDVEDLAAGARPREADGHPGDERALVHLLAHEHRRAQELLDPLRRHHHRVRLALGVAPRHLADDARDLPLQVAEPGFAGVLADELLERVVAKGHLLGVQPVVGQ